MGFITFNSLPLILPDLNDELNSFLFRFHNVEDVINWCNESFSVKNPRNTNALSVAGVGMPTANFPNPPQLSYNTLVWRPVGASQFSYFVGLCPNQTASGIPTGQVSTLSINDGTTTVSASMFKLCQRAITFSTDSDPNGLSLIILVDSRYWLTQASIGNVTSQINLASATTPRTSWNTLLTYLQTKINTVSGLSLTWVGIDDTKWFVPDLEELEKDYANLGAYVDAVTMSVGKRCVLGLDNTFTAFEATDTIGAVTNNFTNITKAVAGNNNYQLAAGQFEVSYPLLTESHAYCNGIRQNITLANPSSSGNSVYAILTTMYASVANANSSISSIAGNSNILNKTNCQTLATNLWTQWMNWTYGNTSVPLRTLYDVTFNGMNSWQPNGYDAFIIYTSGNEREQAPCTRAISLPANFGLGVNYSQDPSLTILEGPQWGYITSTTTSNTSTPPSCNWNATTHVSTTSKSPATVQIANKVYNTQLSGALDVLDQQFYNWTSNSFVEVNAYGVSSGDCYNNGDRVLLEWNCLTNKWTMYKLQGKAKFIAGTLKTGLGSHGSPPASATVNITTFWQGYSPTLCLGISDDVTVFDVTNIFSGSAGTYFIASLDECSGGRYIFLALGCP